jgi:hypothetical protein
MYAHRFESDRYECGFFYFNVHACEKTTALCNRAERVRRIEIREVKEGEKSPYWGWLDAKTGKISMVYPSRGQLNMCFPYGPDAEVNAGRGRPVNLVIIVI